MAEKNLIEEDAEDTQDEGRRTDPEVLTIQQLTRKLSQLDEDAAEAVVSYLHDRFVMRRLRARKAAAEAKPPCLGIYPRNGA